MRHFKQLSDAQIRQIYVAYLSGEPKLAIARRFNIDNSTVHYHVNKINGGGRGPVYALIAPQCAKGHTSFKCLVCGKAHDNIMSEEFQLIIRLKLRIQQLEQQLSHEAPTTHREHHSPIRTVCQ